MYGLNFISQKYSFSQARIIHLINKIINCFLYAFILKVHICNSLYSNRK